MATEEEPGIASPPTVENDLIRVNKENRIRILKALTMYARTYPGEVFPCFLLAQSMIERRRGPRKRWQGRLADNVMLAKMEIWSKGDKA